MRLGAIESVAEAANDRTRRRAWSVTRGLALAGLLLVLAAAGVTRWSPWRWSMLLQPVYHATRGWPPKRGGRRAESKWRRIAPVFAFKRQQPALRHHTRQLARCLNGAADEHGGTECLARYFSVLPHDVVVEALRKGEQEAEDAGVTRDVKALTESLRGCIDVSSAWTGASFCLQDLVANVPRAVVRAAVVTAKAHPAFDFGRATRAAAHRDATALSACVDNAVDVSEGTRCLAAFLAALPRALSTRAVRLATRLPAQPASGESNASVDLSSCRSIFFHS